MNKHITGTFADGSVRDFKDMEEAFVQNFLGNVRRVTFQTTVLDTPELIFRTRATMDPFDDDSIKCVLGYNGRGTILPRRILIKIVKDGGIATPNQIDAERLTDKVLVECIENEFFLTHKDK
jgi:hypothetical protein